MARVHTPKRFWIGFDLHVPHTDPIVDKIVSSFLADFKPHFTVAGGDWMTCDQVSVFDSEDPTELKQEFALVKNYLDKWKITHYFEGNHEERIRRVGSRLDQRIRSMCSVPENLELAARKISWIPYDPRKGVLRLGELKILHGWYANQYFARKTAEVYGTSVFGHAHRFQTMQSKDAFDTRVGFGIGMLGSIDQPYVVNRPPMGWAQGFVFGYVHKNGWFDLYPVRINAGRVTINGKVYGQFRVPNTGAEQEL